MDPRFVSHPAINHPSDEPDKHTQVLPHEPPHNTNEGSEYMDDAIRMKDQPYMYTEESVATGSPWGLL